MRLKTAKGSEAAARIKAAADLRLGAHGKLSVVVGGSRLYVVCVACDGRWLVRKRDGPAQRPQFLAVIDGDGYCEDGATNYFDADGNVAVRI